VRCGKCPLSTAKEIFQGKWVLKIVLEWRAVKEHALAKEGLLQSGALRKVRKVKIINS
jgi:hypothetical protein